MNPRPREPVGQESQKSELKLNKKCLITRMKASESMGDLITILLVLVDFQIYQMVLKARDHSELAMLVLVDLFIWLLAVINSHK